MYIEIRGSDEGNRHREAVDNALKEFKRRMKKSGILQDLKRYESYMSPSKKKKFRKNEAIKRNKREQRKLERKSFGE
jgi:ribosomal protein S21